MISERFTFRPDCLRRLMFSSRKILKQPKPYPRVNFFSINKITIENSAGFADGHTGVYLGVYPQT